MNLEKITRDYFLSFEQKNLDELSDMFHEEVLLKDWNLDLAGKGAVLEANRGIFSSVSKLKVNVENLYTSGMTVIAEISILVNDETTPLPVVDIIKFVKEHSTEDLKIISIVAYRGN